MDHRLQRLLGLANQYPDGELEAVFDFLSPDVVWISHGPDALPWAGKFHGVDGVRRYYEAMTAAVSQRSYTIRETIHSEDWVVNLVAADVMSKATGNRRLFPKTDVIHFDGDLIGRFEEYYDTASALQLLSVSD